MYAIRMLADVYEEELSVGARVLKKNSYIDDIGKSVSNQFKAEQTTTEVDNILAAGKFAIKAWNSNCAAIDKDPDQREVNFLGHVWDKEKDTIKGKPKTFVLSEKELTKINVLELTMKEWDPLGLLLPVTMKHRMHLQAMWESGFRWDDALPEELGNV